MKVLVREDSAWKRRIIYEHKYELSWETVVLAQGESYALK